MTAEIVERVRRSARYRDVDAGLLDRLAGEELARARNVDDAVKRVKRRLHQAVGAYRGAADANRILDPIRAVWNGDIGDEAFRAACRTALARHASTAERLPDLERFFPTIWDLTGGPPSALLDLGSGIGPLMLPWMGLPADSTYRACDVDSRSLGVVEGFLSLVGQPAQVEARDIVAASPPPGRVDAAMLLKLIPLLDRQDPSTAGRCLAALDAKHAVVSFPVRTLGGHRRGMEATYRRRIDDLVAGLALTEVREASVPNELVFVLTLHG